MAEENLIIDERFPLQSPAGLQDVYVPYSSVGQNLKIGFRNGFKETTIGLVRDLVMKQNAKQGINLISQEDWNEDNPYFVEDVDWHDELSTDIAKNVREYRAHQDEMQMLSQRAGGKGYSISQFVGGFGGALMDPINIIPVSLVGGVLAKSLKVGVYNMLLDTAIYAPLAEYTEDIRGRDLTLTDHAINAGFAFGAGATFNAILAGGGAFIRSLPLSKSNNKQKQKIILDNDKKLCTGNITGTNKQIDINAAHSRGTATKIGGTASTASNFIKNYNLNEVGKIYVDEKGLVFSKGGEGRTKVELVDNNLEVTGDLKNIAKLLPALRTIAPDIDNLKIKSASVTETIARENIDTRITELLDTVEGAKVGSDKINRYRITVGDEKYDLEFDEVTGEITAGYIVKQRKNGEFRRSKKLNADELEAVKRGFEEDNANFINKTNRESRNIDETADEVIVDARSGSTTI